jgi:hypothetical protein
MSEIAEGFRPYAIHLGVDFLISASMWLSLYVFKLLTHLLSIDGWPGAFIDNVHSFGIVMAFLSLESYLCRIYMS